MAATSYPQIILLGDSIFQRSVTTLQSDLQLAYIRRADIINRGFGGYTAPAGLRMLKRFLPPSSPTPSPTQPQIKLLVVFFGANDSVADRPGYLDARHVPISEFADALREIVRYSMLQAHGTRLLLITPPPVDEYQLQRVAYAHGRTAANTARYAQAVRDVGNELNVPIVDAWGCFMRIAGWQQGDDAETLPGSVRAELNFSLQALLSDGLHLTKQGYAILSRELMTVIDRDLLELSWKSLPLVLSES